MIVLPAGSSLTYVQAAAHTSVDGNGYCSWEDRPVARSGIANPILAGGAAFVTNGTTIVTLAAAPPAGYVRVIKSIWLNNIDTGTITPKIGVYDGTNTRFIFTGTRATLEQLVYVDGSAPQAYTVALARQ